MTFIKIVKLNTTKYFVPFYIVWSLIFLNKHDFSQNCKEVSTGNLVFFNTSALICILDFLNLFFNWRKIALQYCVGLCWFLPYKTISQPWLYIHFQVLKCSSPSFGDPGLYFSVFELFSIWLELIGREYEVFLSSCCMLVGHTELCSVHHREQSSFLDCFCMRIFENISIFLWIDIVFFSNPRSLFFSLLRLPQKREIEWCIEDKVVY